MSKPVTERVKKWRKRRRRGEVCVTIRLNKAEVLRLAEMGYLDEPQTREVIRDAAEAFASDMLAR
jgi:hypothetical protein